MPRSSKPVSLALLVLGCLAACGGTVVFEEDGGRGDGDGDGGGGRNGSSDVTSTAATTRPSSTASTALASTSTGLGDCFPDSHHPCDGGATCIPIVQVCDGSQDCADGSDELGCGACPPSDFTCADASCIDVALVCDGVVDCPRAEDEAVSLCGSVACDGETLPCFEGPACINRSDVCDGKLDCATGEDEDPPFCQQDGEVCALEIFVEEPADAYCLTYFCCTPFSACMGAGEEACFDCFEQGGGAVCDDALACAASNCGF